MQDTLDAKILIVDEDPQTVGVLRTMLSRAGYRTVESTSDLRRAPMHYLSFRPDLTLFALTPPFEDGFEALGQLKALAEDDYVSVLVMSASSERTMRLHALESGAKDFLVKPVDRVEAITRIRNLVEVRQLHTAVLRQKELLTETVALRTSELRAANEELHATRLEIILRLGRLAESHDSDAAGHISRVTHAVARLGAALGLDAPTCERLFHASAMHDVGKIGITDRILRKKGRLTPEETVIMRTHTSIGARVLRGSGHELMTMAEQIALTHHEKWDGSGYPNGLKGEEIPLVGRIVAVCDVFDALTSVRSYKKAWSHADAMDEIVKHRGTHFDPVAVRAFERILPQVAELHLQQQRAG
jgi:putative two-component system response regulator